jgi:hypothetical protein
MVRSQGAHHSLEHGGLHDDDDSHLDKNAYSFSVALFLKYAGLSMTMSSCPWLYQQKKTIFIFKKNEDGGTTTERTSSIWWSTYRK